MLIVDVVVLNVALPTIRGALGIPDAQLELASVAYTVTFGSLLIVGGRIGDAFGRRRLFPTGVADFTFASVLTPGLIRAGNCSSVARCRASSAAPLARTTLALITATFPDGADRNRALGVWGAVGSTGAVLGQLVGGLVADVFGWRWIFILECADRRPGGATRLAPSLREPRAQPSAAGRG